MIWQSRVSRSRVRAENGFSLTELLVALAILALITGLAAPRIVGYLSTSKTKAAKIQVEQYNAALELFLIDIGRYPTTEEGLESLTRNVADEPFWAGPYLNKREAPADPWGRAYRYEVNAGAGPSVYSLGADGAPGGTGENADVYPN